MSANPRFAVLMALYWQYDHLTLILTGISLAAVLIGWPMLSEDTPKAQRLFYFGFLVLAFVLIMIGCTYLIIVGGPS
jgi:hypothetical protein